ncbi:hypothetical protein ACFFRR_001615 [Megaselia abdita]
MAFYDEDFSSIEESIEAATATTAILATTFNQSSSISLNDDGEQRLYDDYSQGLLSFASAMCIIFILMGVPGNLITIIALTRCKKVRNATAVFIINLSLSDLLFCCFNLPLAASTFLRRAWVHGDFLCRLFPFFRYGLLAVSLFTILSITINRYVMIGHPRLYPRMYRNRYLGLMIAATWLGAFSALIPTWRGKWGRFGLDRDIGSCSILPDEHGTSPKEFLFTMAFLVPCLCIVICYARIFYIVRKTALKSHQEPSMTNSSLRLPQGKTNSRSPAQDTNHSSRRLIEKHSKTSKDEHSENSSSVSTSSGYPPNPPQVHNNNHQYNTHTTKPNRPYLSKVREDEIKFIDTSVESELPPSLSILRVCDVDDDHHPTTFNQPSERTLPKDTEIQIEKLNDVVDSEDVTVQLDEVKVSMVNENIQQTILQEPSSTSGIETADESDCNPQQEQNESKRKLRKSLKTSISRMTKRNISTANTSGASVLYPGRMSVKDKRLLKMILVIFVSFVVCYLPITVTKIWKNVTEVHTINIMGYLLIYLTTCINPIIYVVMSSEYRQAYWNLLLCRTMKANNRQRNGGGEMARNNSIKAKAKGTKIKPSFCKGGGNGNS